MTTPIPGRPEFGNREHIEALKEAAAQEEFRELPACMKCNGMRDCATCGSECRECDGTGKDFKAFQVWKEKHPGRWPRA